MIKRTVKDRHRMGVNDLCLALIVCATWGISIPISKIAVTVIPPLYLLAVRFTVVALLVVPLVPVPRGHLKQLLWLSITLGMLHFPLLLLGLTHIDASTAVILQQLQVPFGVLLAIAIFGERPSRWRMLGIAIAFTAVVLLVGKGDQQANLIGVVLLVLAAFFCALGNLQMKAIGDISPMVANGWVAFFAVPQLFLASWFFEKGQWDSLRHASVIDIGCIFYLAFATTLLGYGIWYRLLRHHPMSVILPFTLTTPVFGVLSGTLLLGDKLSANLISGALLTIVGVGLVVMSPVNARCPQS